MSTGTCTTHSWNDGAEDDEGFPRMGQRVDQRLQKDSELYSNSRQRGGRADPQRARLSSVRVPATDDDDDAAEPW